MEPTVVTREAFHVLGMQTRIDPMEADFEALWTKLFVPYAGQLMPLSTEPGCYGVYWSCDDPPLVDFIPGVAVPADTAPPPGLVVRLVPAATYAVVEVPMADLGNTWGWLCMDWLPNSTDYVEDTSKACFESFPPGAERGDVAIGIHVAVTRR